MPSFNPKSISGFIWLWNCDWIGFDVDHTFRITHGHFKKKKYKYITEAQNEKRPLMSYTTKKFSIGKITNSGKNSLCSFIDVNVHILLVWV